MTECYKLIFDLALYYTVGGYYLTLLTGQQAHLAGFACLAAVIILDALIRKGGEQERPRPLQWVLPALPLLTLLFRPGLWQMVQMLPIWAYLVWSILSGRVYTEYLDFRYHFSFSLKLLLLMLPGLLGFRRGAALLAMIPYLTLMLSCGVCMLRMLREHSASGLRQGVYMAVFLALAVLLTVGRVPQLLVQALGLVYNFVLAPILMVLAMAVSGIFYGLYLGLRWLSNHRLGKEDAELPTLTEFGESFLPEGAVERYTATPVWLKVIFFVLIGLLAALVLFLIFRRLAGGSVRVRHAVPEQQREKLPGVQFRRRGPGLIRPKEPRLAVRYYYAKFLAECRRRGGVTYEGLTSREVSRVSARLFPEADPETLAVLYRPARYCLRESVSPADAARAAEAWRSLKKSRDPNQG